jgi:ABC-type bacteriocin/lantibiotic exporter with double-glycine peptidase domain
MLKPPRRYAHFLFAAIQSALTSSIAAAIASFNLIWTGGFLGHWLQSWTVAWIVMLPVVIAAAPAILRLSELMTRTDAVIGGDRSRPVLSSERLSRISERGRFRSSK